MPTIIIQKSRLILVYIFIAIAFLLITLRMFQVVILGNKDEINKIYNLNKSSRRGDIYDRNGVLVATDLKTKSLYVSSILVRDPKEIASGLASLFSDLSYSDVLKKINNGKNSKKWVLIRRNLTPSQVDKVQKLQMAGLLFEDDLIRIYPQKEIASHYVGYVDLDRKGLAGMEMQYDRNLLDNKNLYLAMDVRAQDILHDELSKGMEEFRAKGSAGLIIDISNGEILGLSSLPSFDANTQNEAVNEQRFNIITNGSYELGSIMKIFTNAVAFENKLVKMDDVFSVQEPIKYGKFTIKDDHFVKNEMTVAEIFAYSSNIGTVKIAEKIGINLQKEFLEKMGFLKKVDADFPGLGRPIYPKIWREINLFTISYGHGIAITPLHLAMATVAMTNGGTYYKPSFLKLDKQPEGKQLISKETSKIINELLRKVAQEGTGKFANIDGYEVGGKTGTAERAEYGGYNENQNFTSFVSVFPMSKPRYLVYVAFDRPNYMFNTGGMVCAPVAGRIIKNIAPLLNIKPKITQNPKPTL